MTTKVLICGVGGIGCELLKTIIYDKYDITVVDLDTIDISNLNRQLLFDTSHVGKPKALIAQQVIRKLYKINIDAYFKNLFDMDASFFAKFDLIFNCLDNYQARYHISLLSKGLHKPLIDVGSGGYNGQVMTIGAELDGYECFGCTEMPKNETFPVCTIRSNPSKFIHVITWTKEYLFQQLFGEENDLEIPPEASAEDGAILNQQKLAFTSLRKDISSENYCNLVFEKLFISDVESICELKKKWDSTPPRTIDKNVLSSKSSERPITDPVDLRYAAFLFKSNLIKLQKRFLKHSSPIVFNKDDNETLLFLSACSNLRAYCFHIPFVDTFTIKAMAGKIVPIVATTNAIVAGIAAIKAKRMLSITGYDLVKKGTSGTQLTQFLNTQMPTESAANCLICHADYAQLTFNTYTTISDLVTELLKLKNIEIEIYSGQFLVYDIEFTDNLNRKLIDFYAKEHVVTVDFDGYMPWKLIIMSRE
eukprot:NODE_896_length_3330_cov_0.347570.p1 type:complete len:477 gc:universal NODE_896_length_3330_cov_0.347570:194-1624(+)